MAAPTSYLIFQINFILNLFIHNIQRYVYNLDSYFVMIIKQCFMNFNLNETLAPYQVLIIVYNKAEHFFLNFIIVKHKQLINGILYFLNSTYFAIMFFDLAYLIPWIILLINL